MPVPLAGDEPALAYIAISPIYVSDSTCDIYIAIYALSLLSLPCEPSKPVYLSLRSR
jgi:hypothetical protein